MCGYAFEFVAGKSIPAFLEALSRVAEGLENIHAISRLSGLAAAERGG